MADLFGQDSRGIQGHHGGATVADHNHLKQGNESAIYSQGQGLKRGGSHKEADEPHIQLPPILQHNLTILVKGLECTDQHSDRASVHSALSHLCLRQWNKAQMIGWILRGVGS